RMPLVTGQLLRSVLATLPDRDPRREPLQAGLVTVAFRLARYDEVQEAGRRLLACCGDPDRGAEVTWLMAYGLLRAGQPAEAAAALDGAARRPGGGGLRAGRLRAPHA